MTSKSPKKQAIDVDLSLLYIDTPQDEGEGLTTAEIAEKLNCGVNKAQKVIRRALETGKCRTSRRYIKTITGFKQRYVTYVFNEGDE